MNKKDERFSRLIPLFGEEGIEKLNKSHVAVFGIGGVGGFVCEALVRGGIGEITIVDHDTVAESNLNRQIIALSSNIGEQKTTVMKERLLSINPDVIVHEKPVFYLPETADKFDFSDFDYVVDAVDTVTAKKLIILRSKELNIPVISSMGTGNKTDASAFRVADIFSTKVCPLAKVMRHELKKLNIDSLKVVYSEEEPKTQNRSQTPFGSQAPTDTDSTNLSNKKTAPASASFVPGVAGLIIAGEVIKDLSYSIV